MIVEVGEGRGAVDLKNHLSDYEGAKISTRTRAQERFIRFESSFATKFVSNLDCFY